MTENRELLDINIIQAKYLASAVRVDQYPEGDFREIAFIGRSNVGKSSLINSLARHGGLARTSGQPGKTQTINFYSLLAKWPDEQRSEFFLVDLPGYGYARTGQANRRQWSKFIEEYFLKSSRLALVCQLVDVRHPPQASDHEMYEWLIQHNIPVLLIATKADKLSKMALQKNVSVIRKALGAKADQLLAYSSAKGQGRPELLDVIGHVLLQ